MSPSRKNVSSTGALLTKEEGEEGALDVKGPLGGEEEGTDRALLERDEQEAVPEQLQGAAPEGSREPVDDQVLPMVELEEEVPVIIARVEPDDEGREAADETTEEGDKAPAPERGEGETLHQADSLTVTGQLSVAATDARTEGIQTNISSISPSWEVISSRSSEDPLNAPISSKVTAQAASAVSPEGSWEVVSPEPSLTNLPDSTKDFTQAFVFPSVVPAPKKTSPHPKPLGRGFRDDHRVGVTKAQQPYGLSRSLQSSPKKSPQYRAAPISLGSSPKHLPHTSIPHQPPSLHSMDSSHIESLPHYHTEQGGVGYLGFSPSLTTPPTDFSHVAGADRSLSQGTHLVFNPGDRLKLVFTSADSPEQFTCHLVGSAQPLQTQVGPIQGLQELGRDEGREKMAPGTPVLVQSSFDGQWYGGKVLREGESPVPVRSLSLSWVPRNHSV